MDLEYLNTMSTPNEQAAERILKKLEDTKQLSAGSLKALAGKFSSGRMSASEWIVLLKTELQAAQSHATPKA